ncbi:MAG: PilZ domain-containing protein [Bdellovibrionia bacterium]
MNQRTGNPKAQESETRVVDFNEVREKKLEQKRRRTERILFRNLVAVYSVGKDSKPYPVDLIELSEDGCSFQVPLDPTSENPIKNDEIPLRIYFSQDTYLEIFVKIVNARPSIENNVRTIRYGCQVDQSIKAYQAYQLFVRFLKQYALFAHRDLGKASAFYL